MNYLPSKKVLSVLIVVFSIVIFFVVAFGREKSGKVINVASNLLPGEKLTVPKNSDWLGDLESIGVDKVKTQEEEPKTVTDTVSESLVSNYLALKQGGSLDQDSAQKLIDQTVDYYTKEADSKYGEISMINLVKDSGQQSMIDYGENLGKILKDAKPVTLKNELKIITEAFQSGDSSKLKELDPIINIYKNLTYELIKTPVPQTFAKAHLGIVNGARNIALGLIEMKKAVNDPLLGVSSLELYKNGFVSFSEAIKATGTFLSKNGVIYEQGSGGYYLLYGI